MSPTILGVMASLIILLEGEKYGKHGRESVIVMI